jgi:lysozyme family protein
MQYVMVPMHHFARKWVCMVVRSGYHNGAACTPDDPHGSTVWGCAYRYEVTYREATFAQLERIGGITDAQATDIRR